jgi:5-(carboxyamino)imidazole ribonucleotide mutase
MPASDKPPAAPLIGIIMGSKSDWPTMKEASDMLAALNIPHEARIVSAHRTPDLMADYAKSAADRGLLCIIAGAGGAAHLPGMVAAHTPLPVIGVPVKSHALAGLDSLLSIAQMPAGIPVGTVAIGDGRAAGMVAARIVALARPEYAAAVQALRAKEMQA